MTDKRIEVLADASVGCVSGFESAGVAAGLKPDGALDMALVFSLKPCACAAVFTTNAFKAAPVLYDQKVLLENPASLHAVVINSGCANACTGEQGMRDAEATAQTLAEQLGISADEVMVMSTGVIGQSLPMSKILKGIHLATGTKRGTIEAGHAAARAIMTTDTCPKEVAVRVAGGSGNWSIAGMAKGSGMIHPNMATMLSVIVTDVSIAPELLQQALSAVVETSFNMISVDGDTSTNDTVLLMANGAAGLPQIASAESDEYQLFANALEQVAQSLAKGIVRDGEGATRFVEVTVEGARSHDQAKQVAMSVARSLLVKTAIYGQDANWGRIVCAVGYSGVSVQPACVGVWLGDLELVRHGAPFDVDEAWAAELLAETDIPVRITLGKGLGCATVWTCDISHAYVDINAHYRT